MKHVVQMNNTSKTYNKNAQVAMWVTSVSRDSARALVSDYCYNCIISGEPKNKTIIAFPEDVEGQGLISIDKPLEEVVLMDIINLYKEINGRRK